MKKITTSGNLPSYKTQFDKITEAYIRGEIKPEEPKFCFCGTLCDNTSSWFGFSTKGKHKDFGGYTGLEYAKMEQALFSPFMPFNDTKGGLICTICHPSMDSPEYEDLLFLGMTAALEVLKQIHIERGEVIDETPVFTKRTSNTLAV